MASEHKDSVKVVLGTMEFGRPQRETATKEKSHKLCNVFLMAGHTEFDTALMYNAGKTEQILGALPAAEKEKINFATKVNPWGKNSLTAESIKHQFSQCLDHLKVDSVDILYLHAPDHDTPIEETLKQMNELHTQGKFKRFGLSNYAAWQVVDIYHICKSSGYVLPTVYQGMYNGLTRQVEECLFPALRRLGISFYAYNPLAGGLLTGRYKYDDVDNKKPVGRFFGNSWAEKYRARFWHKSYFDAMDKIQEAARKAYGDNVSMVDIALRWCLHNSEMSGKHGDALILGASSLKHLEQNLQSCKHGPLAEEVVKAFDDGWHLCRAQCASYFR